MTTAIAQKVQVVAGKTFEIAQVKDSDAIVAELAYRRDLLNKYGGGFLGIGRTMPAAQAKLHQERITTLEALQESLKVITKALEAGYEPYTPPAAWYGGYLGKPRYFGLHDGRYDVFKGVLPSPVLERYQEARKLGIFYDFIVVSPDSEQFERIAPPSDPVLVGIIKTGRKNEDTLVHHHPCGIEGGVGFLVAQWDLEQDFKKAGII